MELIIQWFNNKSNFDLFMELVLPLFSVMCVFLSTSSYNEKIRSFGFCCGMISQPFWFYAAFIAMNIGLFIISLFFTGLWIYRFIEMRKGE